MPSTTTGHPSPVSSDASDVIRHVFLSFERESVDYCVLRNYEGLPEDHGHDVDILVDSRALLQSIGLVRKAASSLGWKCFAIVRRYGYCGLHFWSDESQEHLLLDLFTQLHWRGFRYADTAYVLGTRVRYGHFWVASRGCESVVTLLKEVLAHGKVKAKDDACSRILSGAQVDPDSFVACMRASVGLNTAEILLDLVLKSRWQTLEHMVRTLRRKLLGQAFLRRPFGQTAIWMKFLVGHLRHAWRRPIGTFIAVIGPDGTGKSTLAMGLSHGLADSDVFKEMIAFHANAGVLPQLKAIKRLWPVKQANLRTRDNGTMPGMVSPHCVLRSLVYVFYYTLDYILGWFPIRRHTIKDNLVVFDRYFYDFFYQRQNRRVPHWFLSIMEKLIPKPDLTVCLAGTPSMIHSRKPELSEDELEIQCSLVRQLAHRLPNAILLNAGQDVQKNVKLLNTAIVSSLATRNSDMDTDR